MVGVGLQVVAVPLHKILLNGDLFKGEVVVGVCPALPVVGVMMILANDIAGSKVWAGVPPPAKITQAPQITARPGESEVAFPGVSRKTYDHIRRHFLFGDAPTQTHLWNMILKSVMQNPSDSVFIESIQGSANSWMRKFAICWTTIRWGLPMLCPRGPSKRLLARAGLGQSP